MRRACLAVLAIALLPVQTPAFERLEGYFIALHACDALQSMKKGTNPGQVTTEARRAYDMLGINKKGGDHYQVRVPGAPVTEERWVAATCGVHAVVAAEAAPRPTQPVPPPPDPAQPAPAQPAPAPAGAESRDNVLALSWQPAFCETRPAKPECRRVNDGALPTAETQLAIHGLWPQPRDNIYCGVPENLVRLDEAGQWPALPAPELDDETRAALEAAMPGTASMLERHEWLKHGTCHRGARGADEYFDDTLQLTDEVNGSAVARFIAENLGRQVSTAEIAALFDREFGEGAGARIHFACARDGGRTLIQEMRIALRGVIGPETGLSELMLAAPPQKRGCARGVVDPAGLQ